MVTCDPGTPLAVTALRRAIKECLDRGSLVFSSHSIRKMGERNIIQPDLVNVLKNGRMQRDPEWVNWHWRYRIETQNYGVIVTFEPDEGEIKEMIIVTAFKNRRRTT